ncbi:MAG: PAS domain S-box protein [Betaproteobacteria bacterium]|nr:PAS domain S-box protein [Betaproteobacteria bacterium]
MNPASDVFRQVISLLVPVITFAFQWFFWADIQPYAWLLFVPAVFISAWIGGLLPGLISTLASTLLATWFFIPPQFTFSGKSPFSIATVGLFLVMGTLFSVFHWKLKNANRLAKEATARLRENEENLSVTLNSIGDAVLATDVDGRVTRINAVAEELTGWQKSEAIGKPVADIFRIINHKTRAPAAIPVATVLESGTIHGLANDTVLIGKEGKETPIADSCAPIRNPANQVIGAVLVFRDVSREYAAQKAIQESASRIQTILDTVADGIISINEKGTIELVNPGAERIFGYAAKELAGQNVSMLMPEPHRSAHDAHLRRYAETGEAHILGKNLELSGCRKDGSTFPLELTVSEMKLGEDRHFIGITRDITVRKEAENLFNRFFSLSLDMLCIASSDGRFKRVNPAFTHTLGWSVEEFTSRPYMDFIHPDDHETTQQEVKRQIETGEMVLKFENRFRHKNGSWHVLSWKSVPDDKGFMYATARDVTETLQMTRKLLAAKEQAEIANRAKDSFLATMSHEIRTPLTGMLGMLELLSLTQLDREQRETLESAWESGRGLLRIVSDILDWSKIEEGKLALSHRPTSIQQLLKDVVNAYSRMASAKSLMLSQEIDPAIGPAYIVDPLRLSQVLNNFVSNAIKFTQSGEIVVNAQLLEKLDSGDRICFSVKDTGIGIPADVQARLFQRYSQESADTARMYGGTGLGLSICKRLTEMMDGQIKVESAPGKGSEFSIVLTLPVSGLPGETVQNITPGVRQREVQPLFAEGEASPLVLAVDDHPVNRDLLARQINLLGLRAETAENGKEALALWRNGRYAMIITDCHMPEMDGYSLVAEIRRIEQETSLSRTPVIAWTANALAEEADRCERSGIDDILVKPVDMMNLRAALAKWLGVSQKNSGNEPIQWEILDSIVQGREAQKQVLKDFLKYLRNDHEKLLGQFERGDLSGIEGIAHRMKGSSLMVGARDLAETFESIVQAARNSDFEAASAAKEALSGAIGVLETYLAAGEHS